VLPACKAIQVYNLPCWVSYLVYSLVMSIHQTVSPVATRWLLNYRAYTETSLGLGASYYKLLWRIFSFNQRGGTLRTAATYWPIVSAPDDRWWWLWRNWWNEDWQGKPKYSEKTCPNVTLSTTNPTCLDPGLNPGRRGGKPATNHLNYGAAVTYLAYLTNK
jgi:hypothetical protein